MKTPNDQVKFDIFIAHAGADVTVAVELHGLLKPHLRPFVDAIDLLPGAAWDDELPGAQRASRVTVVLVSQRTTKAWYQREEVAGAIDLARNAGQRVVPVYLEGREASLEVPYGLRRLNGIYVESVGGLAAVSLTLVRMHQALFRLVEPFAPVSAESNILEKPSGRGFTVRSTPTSTHPLALAPSGVLPGTLRVAWGQGDTMTLVPGSRYLIGSTEQDGDYAIVPEAEAYRLRCVAAELVLGMDCGSTTITRLSQDGAVLLGRNPLACHVPTRLPMPLRVKVALRYVFAFSEV